MHFVVANIVRPLTIRKQVSFVNLWGGRPVDYFVSHSWGTSFQHFVKCIRRHADFVGAPNDAYWICSFANNQWDIASELGTSVMDSAFARVLQAGVKGVVMVLDHEVQPLTRTFPALRARTHHTGKEPQTPNPNPTLGLLGPGLASLAWQAGGGGGKGDFWRVKGRLWIVGTPLLVCC